MHKLTLAFLLLVLAPTVVFALTIEPGTLYKDVRPSSPEAAGINMLSREGIVQGYGNGFFGLSRQINRAEFLKMAMMTVDGAVLATLADCFPDVQHQWFALFICTAYADGIVAGYTDGRFHPEDIVSYGEALKILSLLFGYEVTPASGHWAESYYQAAAKKGVDLPVTIDLDTPLTRGLTARLTAAFFAESEGQLSEFRFAEAGQYASPVSSPSFSSSVSSSPVSSSSSLEMSSSSSSVSQAALFTLPPVSHFLIVGRTSDAIADLTIQNTAENVSILSAQVKLVTAVASLDTLELVTADSGKLVATLRRRATSDTTDYLQTYEVQLTGADRYQIPAGRRQQLVLRANIRGTDTGGSSEQLLEVRTFSVTYYGESTKETINVPVPAPFPKHQTSFGRITAVARVSPVSAPLVSGTSTLVSAFSFSGSALPGKTLSLKQLTFAVLSAGTVSVRNWHVQTSGSAVSVSCSFNEGSDILSCPNLDSIAVLPADKPLMLEVRGDIAVRSGSTGNTLEINLDQAGSPSEFGSVQWTDQAGNFKWVEGSSPLAPGTKFR
ncbi:S-layer homology domain-containing protein [Candidatus Peribacteria bacterium]|nr:S-layer homology domain-containing protein [Candidatus Peribacteria bacterium]